MSEPHTTAGTEVPAHETEATAFGFLTAPMAISIAMIVVLAILVWKKVPAAIARPWTTRSRDPRPARGSRNAAQGSRSAESRICGQGRVGGHRSAKAMLERARLKPKRWSKRPESDAEALVERRGQMAEEKIAAEERAAAQKLRAARPMPPQGARPG